MDETALPTASTSPAVEAGQAPATSHRARSPRRRAMVCGGATGGVLGAWFFTAYTVAAAYLCLPDSGCPSSWVPYFAIAAIGFLASIAIGVGLGLFFRKLYLMFKVD